MFRFFLISMSLIVFNVLVGYVVRCCVAGRYIPLSGSLLASLSLQAQHIYYAATNIRTRYGLCGLLAATLFLFFNNEGLSTDYYVMHFFVGLCVLIHSVYVALLINKELPTLK